MGVNNPTFTIITSLRKKYRCFFDDLFGHIINQTYSDFECLVIIDEDDVCLPKLDNRFRILKVEPQWLSTKRNLGIKEAKGDYVIFCDADDYFDVNLLSVCNLAINTYKPDIVFPKATRDYKEFEKRVMFEYIYFKNDEVKEFFFSRYIQPFYKDDIYIKDGCWGRAYKRQLLIDNNILFIKEPCRAEDAIFNNDVALKAISLVTTPSYFGYYWRINDSSEMNNVFSPFYNIFPFGEHLKHQLLQCDRKYSVDSMNYLASIIKSQITIFYTSYLKRKIKKKELINFIESFIPNNSFCKESLLFYINNTKSIYEKKFYSKIYEKKIRQSIVIFNLKLFLNKIKLRIF